MKALLISIFWLLTTVFWLPSDTEELKITVSNISPLEGELYIAVYNSPETYMDTTATAMRKIVTVTGETQTILLKNLSPGNYAIAIFQDLNANGLLDTKGIGVPAEPFGFSNDARGSVGPPEYKDALLILDSPTKEITINVK